MIENKPLYIVKRQAHLKDVSTKHPLHVVVAVHTPHPHLHEAVAILMTPLLQVLHPEMEVVE